MNINKLLSKPHLFRRVITLSVFEFQTLSDKLYPEWKKCEFKRLAKRTDRLNAIGQGRPYALGSFDNLLLCALIYLRTNIGHEILSLLFDIDPATVKRVIKRIMPLLQDRFIPKTQLTQRKRRINTLDELIAEYPGIEDVIFDGTEIQTPKPKRRQKQSYSGKKKRHTRKFQLAQDKRNSLIIGVSPPAKGKLHDKKQLDQTGWDNKLSEDINRWADLGYIGMHDPNDAANWILPFKSSKNNPLTKNQKKINKQIARERIKIEHTIANIKTFKRIGTMLTVKTDNWLSSLFLASVNLVNYKTLMRQGIN